MFRQKFIIIEEYYNRLRWEITQNFAQLNGDTWRRKGKRKGRSGR